MTIDEDNSEKGCVPLCPTHSHFIFADDGSENQFGREVDFRSRFENELRRNKLFRFSLNRNKGKYEQPEQTSSKNGNNNQLIPMIVLVVQGGLPTLKAALNAIRNDIPLLVLAVLIFKKKKIIKMNHSNK